MLPEEGQVSIKIIRVGKGYSARRVRLFPRKAGHLLLRNAYYIRLIRIGLCRPQTSNFVDVTIRVYWWQR